VRTLIAHGPKRVKVEGVKREVAERIFEEIRDEAYEEHSHPGCRIVRAYDDYHEAKIIWIGYNEHNYEIFTPMDYIMAHVEYEHEQDIPDQKSHLMIDYQYYFYCVEDTPDEFAFPIGREFIKQLKEAHKKAVEVEVQ